MGKHQTD